MVKHHGHGHGRTSRKKRTRKAVKAVKAVKAKRTRKTGVLHKGSITQIPREPYIPSPNKSINPGDNFYKYINSNWIKHARISPYKSNTSVSDEIDTKINKQLLEIIYDAQANITRDHTSHLIGTYMTSIVDKKSQLNNIEYLNSILSKINCIRSIDEVGCILGEFIRQNINTFLSINTSPSDKNNKSNYITFSRGTLGLNNTKYYTEKHDITKHRIFNHYKKLLAVLEKDFRVEALETLADIEHKVAPTLFRSIQSDNDSEEILKGSVLLKRFKYIPWETTVLCSMNTSLKDFEKTEYLSVNPTWLKYLNTLFHKFPLTIWKVWLSGNIIIHTLPVLPPPYDNYHFDLFDNKMRGQTEKISQERLGLYMIRRYLSAHLGELYIKKCVSSKIKEEATELVNKIKDVAEERLGNLEWLEEKTRKNARLKIKNIIPSIAYPSNFESITKTYNHIKLSPLCSLQNTFILANCSFQDIIRRAGTPKDLHKWTDQVFVVNAYYYNEGNNIIIPSGILSWPFFHVAASYGWNYGAIGCVIGHELTHAFDADGKDYDHMGVKRSWWTKKDNNEYKKRARYLEKMYSETCYFGKNLDGELTLSENIADLGGVALSLSALKDILDKNKIQGDARKKQICDFFKSFAVSWRSKDKEKAAIRNLFIDVHSPAVVRINNIVSQFDDWYECFDIKPSDPMYISSKDRVRIF